jgi:hypothetical protein
MPARFQPVRSTKLYWMPEARGYANATFAAFANTLSLCFQALPCRCAPDVLIWQHFADKEFGFVARPSNRMGLNRLSWVKLRSNFYGLVACCAYSAFSFGEFSQHF